MKYSADTLAMIKTMLNTLVEHDLDGLLDAYHRKEDIAAAARQVSDMALSIATVADNDAVNYHDDQRKGDRYVSTKSL